MIFWRTLLRNNLPSYIKLCSHKKGKSFCGLTPPPVPHTPRERFVPNLLNQERLVSRIHLVMTMARASRGRHAGAPEPHGMGWNWTAVSNQLDFVSLGSLTHYLPSVLTWNWHTHHCYPVPGMTHQARTRSHTCKRSSLRGHGEFGGPKLISRGHSSPSPERLMSTPSLVHVYLVQVCLFTIWQPMPPNHWFSNFSDQKIQSGSSPKCTFLGCIPQKTESAGICILKKYIVRKWSACSTLKRWPNSAPSLPGIVCVQKWCFMLL